MLWDEYLANPVGLDEHRAAMLRDLWAALDGALPPPQVEPWEGDEDSEPGDVRLSWSRADYYAEVVLRLGTYEWFAKSHKTGRYNGTTEPIEVCGFVEFTICGVPLLAEAA